MVVLPSVLLAHLNFAYLNGRRRALVNEPDCHPGDVPRILGMERHHKCAARRLE